MRQYLIPVLVLMLIAVSVLIPTEDISTNTEYELQVKVLTYYSYQNGHNL